MAWGGVGWGAVAWGGVGCCVACVFSIGSSMASVFIPQVENYRNCLQTFAVQMSTPTSDILQPVGHSVILCGGEGGGCVGAC